MSLSGEQKGTLAICAACCGLRVDNNSGTNNWTEHTEAENAVSGGSNAGDEWRRRLMLA